MSSILGAPGLSVSSNIGPKAVSAPCQPMSSDRFAAALTARMTMPLMPADSSSVSPAHDELLIVNARLDSALPKHAPS